MEECKIMRNLLKKNSPRAAIFMSGSGTNAEKLLMHYQETVTAWQPVVIVTDRPGCRAKEIAERFGLPYEELDIREFYREKGLNTISIATQEGMQVRELWTDALRARVQKYDIDFGIFAGFEPLTNLVNDFPCLNVHPGDLTVEKDGIRTLVGLHVIPIERAILAGYDYLRSSVLIVGSVSCGAKEMDEGPVLGISGRMPMPFTADEFAALKACAAARAGKKRAEFKGDLLSSTAAKLQEQLKIHGDWVLFPQVVDDFAAGCFCIDDNGQLYYKGAPVRTVEYSASRTPEAVPE